MSGQRADAGLGRPVEPAQSRDDLARRPRARDAAHRARLGRWLHRAGAAPAPLDRHARVDRRHRSPRPSRRPCQRHGRRAWSVPSAASCSGSSSGSPTGRASSRARTTSSGCSPCRGSSSLRRWCSRSSRRSSPPPDPLGRSLGYRSSPRSRAAQHRPARVHRSAIPGIVFLGRGVPPPRLLGKHGQWQRERRHAELALGIVLLIPGLILLAPFFLSLTAGLARRAPIAPRLALRDLARYRAALGLGARGDQPRGTRRGHRHARRRLPLRKRPRLRGPEPRL